MSDERKLRVIEVKDGRLPEGISGKDITGPIVLMTDGKLPADFSEEYLIQINATILSVKTGEDLPRVIPQSVKQQFLQSGISEEKLEKAGYIIIEDEVVKKGAVEAARIGREKAKVLYEAIEQELIRVREEGKDVKRIQVLQEIKDGLETLLDEKARH